jgi:hypothetical protein
MTKNAGKGAAPQRAQHPPMQGTPTAEDLRTAYEIHTLAQMVYGQLAATHPWMATQTWPMGTMHHPAQPMTSWPRAGTPTWGWPHGWGR